MACELGLAGGAERALHGAAELRGQAGGQTLAIWDEDGFDLLIGLELEEDLHGVVTTLSAGEFGGGEDGISAGEVLAQGFAEVGHGLEGRVTLVINPLEDLLGAVGGQREFSELRAKLVGGEAQDVGWGRLRRYGG